MIGSFESKLEGWRRKVKGWLNLLWTGEEYLVFISVPEKKS